MTCSNCDMSLVSQLLLLFYPLHYLSSEPFTTVTTTSRSASPSQTNGAIRDNTSAAAHYVVGQVASMLFLLENHWV
jgi:hypothetical protein